MKKPLLVLVGLLLLAAPALKAQFEFVTNGDAITITGYTGSGGAVTIPTNITGLTVTSVGESAFENCFVLTSVTIPDSVSSIGDYAFFGCAGLTNVTIPGSVASLGLSVFEDCGLTSVTIANGVISIGDSAFLGCSSLTSITIPGSVTSIGNYTFESCTSLTSIMIPGSVISIGYSAFNSCTSLASIYFTGSAPSVGVDVFAGDNAATVYYSPGTAGWSSPLGGLQTALWNASILSEFVYSTNEGIITITGYSGPGGAVTIPFAINDMPVTSIGQDAFLYCTNLISLVVPGMITSIGDAALAECSSLASVTIPYSVSNIGEYAFLGCSSLTSLTIPGGVTMIGDGAFAACTSLASVYVTGNAPSVGPDVFAGDDTATVYYSPGTVGWSSTFGGLTAVIWNPSSVSQFNYTAYSGTISITGYTGPGGAVTIPFVINGLPVTSIGQGAFFSYSSLTSVMIPGSISSIAGQAFYGCTSLARVTIPGSVTSIGEQAFSITALTGVSIPGSVASMGGFAFAVCNNMTNVTIADGVTSIGYAAFDDCSGLNSVTIPGSVASIEDYAFSGCSRLTNAAIDDGVASIGNYAFNGCSSLASVAIPDSVTSVGEAAFNSCSSLTSVTIPSSVTSIGADAFQSCPSLTAITVDSQNSFYSSVNGVLLDYSETALIQYPNGLRGSYVIPGSVTCVGEDAFSGCSGLTSVTIPGSVTNIGADAFAYCMGLTAITVDSQNSFYSSANGVLFDNSETTLIQYPGGLSGSYVIPANVMIIGDDAFLSCLLTSVTIPGSVANIETNAFGYCSDLTSVFCTGNAPATPTSPGPPPPPGLGPSVFTSDTNATVYYLPGTTGWSSTFSGLPAVLWLPEMQSVGASFGVGTNGFGFNISWADGLTIVVEACTNLANPFWQPLQTNTLINGTFNFSDPQWLNYPARYYRIKAP